MTAIIAVMNHKGGVGKTTTTLNLASVLAAGQKSVLIIDMDPQSNAATGLGVDLKSISKGSYELILGDAKLADVACETGLPGVYLVPATFELAALSSISPDDEDPEYWLRESLGDEDLPFDYILFDCPPSFGILSLNALVAAQKVIIPVQSESFAIAGLHQMEKSINDIRREAKHDLDYRILMTLSDESQQLHKLVDREIRSHFSDHIFATSIPVEPKIAESAFLGRPVVLHSPNSKGARAYIDACVECLTWVEGVDAVQSINHKQRIMDGLKNWLADHNFEKLHMPEASSASDQSHFENDPMPRENAIQPEAPNTFRIGIRNGVILALALTAGMALALLGL